MAGNQRGQGTVEYMLVLIVAVTIILGGLYQLNSAFKAWANNYFGDYLACLLETGELPTIGGSPGDSGTCEQLFKPFSFAEGRPAKNPITGGGKSDSGEGKSGGLREGNGNRRASSGGGGNFSGGGGRFRGGSNSPGGNNRPRSKVTTTNTGNTGTSSYGGGYTYYQRPQKFASKNKLDNKFAFDDGREKQSRRQLLPSASRKKDDEGNDRGAFKMKPKSIKRSTAEAADTGFTIGNFIKYVILAIIILALLFFLAGQTLSITKSME